MLLNVRHIEAVQTKQVVKALLKIILLSATIRPLTRPSTSIILFEGVRKFVCEALI